MRITTEHTENAWKSETKVGPMRPVARATIQSCNMRRHSYDTDDAPGGDYDHERSRRGIFTNILFGGGNPREIRNLRKVSWTRSVDQDAAECTMTVLNADILPMGDSESGLSDAFELPGYFTFSRGETDGEARWGYGASTGWNRIMTPDRLVRTYEGYGCDDEVPPGDDDNLYLSGTWLVDQVAYTAEGDISITMRDLARLLIEHIAFPPVVPWDDYPMTWSTIRSDLVAGRDVTGGSWAKPAATATSSNNLYIGEGIVDNPTYVGASGGVQGHQNQDPLRGTGADWWLSTGQESPDSVVWWEEEFDVPHDMNGIKIHTVGGPYRVYVSLQRDGGAWYGKRRVPYEVTTGGVDLAAGGVRPLFAAEGPEFFAAAFAHNSPFAVAGPYQTTLTGPQEATFLAWVNDYDIPFDPDAAIVDYDMRGFWLDEMPTTWTEGDHFPDTFKTPYDTTFSAESQYATVDCPFHWHGDNLIDERDGSVVFGEASVIKFVYSAKVERGQPMEITLRRKYRNVKKLRLTFTRLRRHIGGTYPWRAALKNIEIYKGAYASLGFAPGEVLTPVGNISDFTDAVKWMLAWCGFFWPEAGADNWIKYQSGVEPELKVHYEYEVGDSRLPKGRVWGSFQNTGTAPIADMTADQFDKQPMADCINVIKDIIGFNFWIDECGGPVWRMPNLYTLGNYVSPHHKLPRRAPERTTDIVIIDEEETLISYSTTLSSRNLRDYIFVGDAMGKFGTTIRGYNPVPSGMRRTAGWTDSHFESNREARVAADMIAARQMFDWRRGKVTIPGNPAIQIDDQVRIWERVANETYYHYVIGISSTIDNDAGTWTYELDTHWLGDDPTDAWVVRVDQLDGMTQNYLETLGGVD